MSNTNEGTPSVEQPVIGTQPTEQAAVTNAGEQPVPAQPSIEALQQQIAQERTAREQQEQSYKALQSEFTRKSQALAQLAGTQLQPPQGDPLASQVEFFTKRGYDAKQGRDLAEFMQSQLQPLQQQYQQSFRSLQQQSILGNVLQDAYAKDAALFADPEIYRETEATLRDFTSSGGSVTPEFALQVAVLAKYERERANGGQQQSRPLPPAQPFANGQFNVRPGYQPQANPNPTPILSTDQQAADAEIKARYNLNPRK